MSEPYKDIRERQNAMQFWDQELTSRGIANVYQMKQDIGVLLDANAALEAKLSKMDGLTIQISDGDVWLHFPNAAISIEGICRFGAPGPIVKKNLRAWRDEALAGGDED